MIKLNLSFSSFTVGTGGAHLSTPHSGVTLFLPAVSDPVGNLSCEGVSWDSVQLSWELPANPNGQILFYEIQLEVDMQSYIQEAHTAQHTVSGLSPDQEYTLSVAAVNSAGPGDKVNCTASTLSESGAQSPSNMSACDS